MLTDTPNIKEVTDYVIHIVYNRPLKEKTLGDARYNMIKTKEETQMKRISRVAFSCGSTDLVRRKHQNLAGSVD